MEPNLAEKIRNEVIAKLNPRNLTAGKTFDIYSQEYEQIYNLLENTFKLQEGKSAIIIGPRGIGKTVLVENALNDLKNQKKYDFFAVRLNGSFFRDDSIAIKEIARQLDWYLAKYNPSERETLKRATFEQRTVTNTMNVIIDILDRTRLNEEDEEFGIELKDGDGSNKRVKAAMVIPVVFIIDEIDRYTHSAKQTLLYNLFDMAQSSSSKTGGGSSSFNKVGSGTTISVIGMSTKTTVREQLEKRVKSRFSQRIIQINKIRGIEEFCQCIYDMVSINLEEETDTEINDMNRMRKEFNEMIKKEIFEKGRLRRLIVENYYTIRDLNALRNELIVYIMNEFNQLMYKHMKDYKNGNIDMITTLSESELKMLISCCRAKIKNNVFQINFDMAFDEYWKMMLMERRDIQAKIQVVGMSLRGDDDNYLLDRDAMQICWERLCGLGLLEGQVVSSAVCGVELDDLATSAVSRGLAAWLRVAQ